MKRDEALKKLKEKAYDEETIHQEFEYISNKLGITKEELQVFFNAPTSLPGHVRAVGAVLRRVPPLHERAQFGA